MDTCWLLTCASPHKVIIKVHCALTTLVKGSMILGIHNASCKEKSLRPSNNLHAYLSSK